MCAEHSAIVGGSIPSQGSNVAVITSIYGDFDELLQPPEQTVNAEWILVTEKEQDGGIWDVRVDRMQDDAHPRLRAKRPKMIPWVYTSADLIIWLDASARILTPTFLEELIDEVGYSPLTQYRHPDRDCIYDEAIESLGIPKYAQYATDIELQIEGYRVGDKHPEHWGLWATGLIAWQPESRQIRNFGNEWLKECKETSYQDQLSEPPILRSFDLLPKTFTGSLRDMRWVEWRGHKRED